MYIPIRDLLAPGADFGDRADYCYIGVFESQSGVDDLWEIGSKFFRRYYVVYDASVYQERDQDFLLLGIAPKNPAIDLLKP
jgi:hypothetical protein